MTARRPIRLAAPRRAAIALLGAVIALSSAAEAAPYVPDDDGVVLERLPDARSPEARELRALRAGVAAAPGELEPALALARRALALGQSSGDPRLVGQAEAALAPWLAAEDPPIRVLVLHATVQQNRHRFGAALETLQGVLARDPRNAQAWLTRAMIELVQGEPRAALVSCARLWGRAEPLFTAGCADLARSRAGEARAGFAALAAALAQSPDASPGAQVFAELALGEMAARLGEPAQAEAHLRRALALSPGDFAARAELADLLLDQGRPAEVRELLAHETRADPLILRLALAERALGDPAFETHAALLEARAAEGRLRGEDVHAREEARLALARGDTSTALERARASFAAQREPADARVLLEAARAAGDAAAARPVLDWLSASSLEDARLASLMPASGEGRP